MEGNPVFKPKWLLSREDAEMIECWQLSQEENGDQVKAEHSL